ncbi:tripartite tricarboxylate transporter TctB family protein [Cypionkella sp.]|jgi:putative tricarboxylic transport membrane protein|uniref:tripartite tricarboxylate transporter TctB family protein n=1 Tax=Cypionkella sp. TaxID=2811411 RepID=UPI0027733183|nr:tripartite tricarboxylate transporter TctB family protein [Cypionkella sp.]
MSSDRIFGLVVVMGALAFFAGALQIQTSFLSDPVGPRVFPMLIAASALLCGLVLIAKPDAEPEWPALAAWGNMAIALVVLVSYALLIGPMGFLASTALAAAGVSYLIEKNARTAALTGLGLSLVLFVIFKYGLGLGLFAFPRAWMG